MSVMCDHLWTSLILPERHSPRSKLHPQPGCDEHEVQLVRVSHDGQHELSAYHDVVQFAFCENGWQRAVVSHQPHPDVAEHSPQDPWRAQ